MRWPQLLRLRLRALFLRRRLEAEMEEELRYHLDRQIEELIAQGLPEAEARRQAQLSASGLDQRKEECRDARGLNMLDHLTQDIHFGLRQLRRHPAFSITAIGTLALGICANVAIFAFVDATLIRPLPYHDPANLIGVYETVPMFPRSNLSYLDYLDWKKMNTSFSSLDVYQRTGFIMTTPEGAQPTRGAVVSAGFFRTLGVKPILGRDFVDGEDQLSAPRTVLLSHAAWQKRYSGRPDAVGQSVILNGEPNIIIGVLPSDFHFAPSDPADFWAALHATSSCFQRRSCHNLYGVARLKPGVSFQAALAEVKAIAQRLEKQYPDSNRDQGATLAPLSEVIVGEVRPILLLLLSGAALLLLIAIVNIASLLLVRTESRRREMSVRNALGASRLRLIRQFAAESLLLVSTATAIGLAFAVWSMQLLTKLIPAAMLENRSVLQDLGLNPRVLAFTAALAALSAIIFVVTPALRLSAPALQSGLVEGTRGSAGLLWRRLGSKLVMAELAIAMVLMVAAGLLGTSLFRLLQVDLGIQPAHLATVLVAAPKDQYKTDELRSALARRIVSTVEALPGVQSAALGTSAPLGGNGNTTWFCVLGRPWHGEHNEAPERAVTARYFTTLGARLLKGRYFTDAEDASKPRVAIVNTAFVRQHFPGEEALGRHLSYLSTPPVPIEVVGIVDDIKEGPMDVPTPPVLYIPYHQNTDFEFSVVVRTAGSESAILPLITAAVRKLDSGLITNKPTTMHDRINDSYSAYLHRSAAWLVGGFALLALVLGVVGLYGVIAYSVGQRTREIGVRVALGARPATVYQLILGDAGRLTAGGIIIGLASSLGAAALMRGLLFGVGTWHPPTLLGVAFLLGACALLAAYIPARRAAAVNPIDALRSE